MANKKDVYVPTVGEEIANQGKALFRPMRQRRQTEVDQSQCGCLA